MFMQTTLKRWSALLFLFMLGACGSSNRSTAVDSSPIEPTEVVSAIGKVSARGTDTVTVNGVRYQSSTASVTMNGQAATPTDLRVGHIVSLKGRIEVIGSVGTAQQLNYDATVIGPVESIDPVLGQLVVMGQAVLTDANTEFATGIDRRTLAGLVLGTNAQVSGFTNANGQIIATRVEPDTSSVVVQLIGKVAGLDLSNALFTANGLTIDYSDATFTDTPAGAPIDGMMFLARGPMRDGILMASEIRSQGVNDPGGAPGERVRAQGAITRFDSPADFDLNGVPVTSEPDTQYVSGTVDDLRTNAVVTIDGTVAASGAILANKVAFGRLIGPARTITFDLTDFTEIAVSGVFQVAATQGAAFKVEITIDEDIVNNLDVTKTGPTLNLALRIADNNVETLRAVVTLPVLNRITVSGVSSAAIGGFDQAQMSVDVSGVSAVRGDSLSIDSLVATVTGVSQLNFSDISPIRSASVAIGGVSAATLNMGSGSSLTGSVTGTSRLFYFGTNVVVNVSSGLTASVRRLGATRL